MCASSFSQHSQQKLFTTLFFVKSLGMLKFHVTSAPLYNLTKAAFVLAKSQFGVYIECFYCQKIAFVHARI